MSASPRALDVLTLVAVAVSLGFLACLLTMTDGHFVPQVVDLYLICQYAKAMAEGHPFQYNAGEPYSTGATSLALTTLLAALHWIGVRGEWLIAAAIGIGIACYVASVRLAFRIGARLGTEREATLAGALVALGGPVVWGFLYGSDTAPFLWLALLLFDRLLAGSPRGVALTGSLLSLTRPEGFVIGILLAIAGTGPKPAGATRVQWMLRWAPAAVGLAVLALYRALTGYWVSTSVADKSLVANYGLADTFALVADYLGDVLRGLLLGFYPAETPVGFSKGWSGYYFAPLTLVLIVLAITAPPEPFRRAIRVWTATIVVLSVLIAPNTFMGVHFNRYLMWSFPALHVLSALGLGVAAALVARDAAGERRLFAAGAVVMIGFGALSTARFAVLYGEMAGEIYRRDVVAAHWIEGHLPRGATVANLATSVEYLTGHRNINLHGVTSPAFFGNRTAERDAGVLESLGRLPPAERPAYLLTTATTHEALGWMQEVVDPAPLFGTSSLGDEILVFRMNLDPLGRRTRFFTEGALAATRDLQEVDRLNVCDTRDEERHGYSFESRRGGLRLHGTVRVASYGDEVVLDAGRVILGRESFVVRTARGRDLVGVVRTAVDGQANVLRAGGSRQYSIDLPEAALDVAVGGRPAVRLQFRPAAGWDEQVFRIPGDLLGDGETRLEISGRYASFSYWFFQ